MKSLKLQASTFREAPNSKPQAPHKSQAPNPNLTYSAGSLVIEVSLNFGCWCLELFVSEAWRFQKVLACSCHWLPIANVKTLPHTRSCFVCGESNPVGLKLRFETDGRIVQA